VVVHFTWLGPTVESTRPGRAGPWQWGPTSPLRNAFLDYCLTPSQRCASRRPDTVHLRSTVRGRAPESEHPPVASSATLRCALIPPGPMRAGRRSAR
jgi:hypothetical protein